MHTSPAGNQQPRQPLAKAASPNTTPARAHSRSVQAADSIRNVSAFKQTFSTADSMLTAQSPTGSRFLINTISPLVKFMPLPGFNSPPHQPDTPNHTQASRSTAQSAPACSAPPDNPMLAAMQTLLTTEQEHSITPMSMHLQNQSALLPGSAQRLRALLKAMLKSAKLDSINALDSNRMTVLHKAVAENRPNLIELLMINQAKVKPSFRGLSPLDLAVINGRKEIVHTFFKFRQEMVLHALIQKSEMVVPANPDKEDALQQQNTIINAISSKDFSRVWEAITLLRDNKNNKKQLLLAPNDDDVQKVIYILNQWTDINPIATDPDPDNQLNPVTLALQKPSFNTFTLLSLCGAKLNITDRDLEYSIQFRIREAAKAGHQQAVIEILKLAPDTAKFAKTAIAVAMDLSSQHNCTDLILKYFHSNRPELAQAPSDVTASAPTTLTPPDEYAGIISLLMEHASKINGTDEMGDDYNSLDSAFLHACSEEYGEPLALGLLETGADPNAVSVKRLMEYTEETTALNLAIKSKKMTLLRVLLDRNTNILDQYERFSVLGDAIGAEFQDAVELLLAHIGNPRITDKRALQSSACDTILHHAAMAKKTTMVAFILDYMSKHYNKINDPDNDPRVDDINYKNVNGKTALKIAKEGGQTEIMDMLVNHGAKPDNDEADVKQAAETVRTSSLPASRPAKQKTVHFFDVSTVAKKTLYRWLISNNREHHRLAQVTLGSPELELSVLKYVWLKAAMHGELPILEMLLKKNKESIPALGNCQFINFFDNIESGKTALHLAASNDLYEMTVFFLLGANAEINAQDTNGNTPLSMAALSEAYKVAELLLDKGADVNLRNKMNRNILHTSSEHGIERMVQLIFKYRKVDTTRIRTHYSDADHPSPDKVDINCRSTHGYTPLHFAAEYGHFNIVKLLLAHNAELRPQTIYGETPRELALKNGHYVTSNYLEQQEYPWIMVNGKYEMAST